MNLKNRRTLAQWKEGYKNIILEINDFFYKDEWTTNLTLLMNYITIVFAGLFCNIIGSKEFILQETSPLIVLVVIYIVINCFYNAHRIIYNYRRGYLIAYLFIFIGFMIGDYMTWAVFVGTILFTIGLISNCLVKVFYNKN